MINQLLYKISLFEKLANNELAQTENAIEQTSQEVEPIIAYHGSQVRITRFSPKHSAMGSIIWFSQNYQDVKSGHAVGIQKPKYIMTVQLTPKKVGGWEEYDKYLIDQLISMDYDALKLDSNWIVLTPKIIKYISSEKVD